MTTKEIVEAILYICPDSYKSFRAAHVINDTDRNWTAKEHNEYPFISAFTDPKFLIIISKQIHVFIIGEISSRKSYNIINIEGFNADHMTLNKGGLSAHIKNLVSEKLFLSDSLNDRIIFIKNNKPYIFNKKSVKGTIFSKGDWSLGSDIYDVSIPTYQTNAWEILKAIYQEF